MSLDIDGLKMTVDLKTGHTTCNGVTLSKRDACVLLVHALRQALRRLF